MPTALLAWLVALTSAFQTTTAPAAMQADVDRLVQAAGRLTATWPSQPPPPLPEVSEVARHGKRVAPLLVALLSDDPNAEADPRRWKVQQQAALSLSRIYSESSHCGRSYCDGDPPERIGNVKAGWVRLIASDAEMRTLSAQDLLDRFTREAMFWKQFEIARVLADLGDRTAVAALEAGLTHDDRHRRGNVAFVLARLGDRRGFETLAGILADRSSRSDGQGIPGGHWSLQRQIRADRYCAALLLGHLKDPRAVDLLIALLDDQEVRAIVPWSLAQIGDRRAIGPLITRLSQDDPSMRGLAVHALETLNAREALPRLHQLRDDTRISGLGGRTTVADAARHAIAALSQLR